MSRALDSFTFCQIPSSAAHEAFQFHVSFYVKEFIWLRSEDQMQQYSSVGELFGIRYPDPPAIAGICYVTFDSESKRWELGGLGVDLKAQDLGLGTVLGRYALARTIAEKAPWVSGQDIIAHVHEDNQDPRNLLKRLGFEQKGKEKIPGEVAPLSMRRNAEGDVVGDVFLFPKSAVSQLLSALEADISKPLLDGCTNVIFDLGIWSFDDLRESLMEAAK